MSILEEKVNKLRDHNVDFITLANHLCRNAELVDCQ